MKKLWLIRKDEEAVSPVIATILMVAITVVLAAVLYVMVSGLLGTGQTTAKTVGFSAGSAGNNWTLTVASVSASGLSYTATTFKIFDSNGVPKKSVLLSDVKGDALGSCTNSPAPWGTNHVCYLLSNTANTEIKVGDRMNIDKVTYLSGYKWELIDSTSILAQGTFQ